MIAKTLLVIVALLASIRAFADPEHSDDALPPWDVVEMQRHLSNGYGLDPATVRLLAWHIDLDCPWSTPEQAGNPSAVFSEHALVAAEKEETIFGPRRWVLMLVTRGEFRWDVDICAHCEERFMALDRKPRAEDLRDFIPPLWIEPGLYGYKLVGFGVLERNWKEVFGVEPTFNFKPAKPVAATCTDEGAGQG